MDRSAAGSSISATRPSPASRRSAKASRTSESPGDPGLGGSALRALAERHGIRPSKALGQHFLADPNLARAIVADAAVAPTDRVVEIGAGLGSLTLPLADAAAEVVAIEFDRALAPALEEAVGARANVRIVRADATRLEWSSVLDGDGWILVASLPYNVSVPLVTTVLEDVPAISRAVVMVQREVADRLAATAGDAAYGPVSIRVAFHARAERVRSVPASVFWPRPTIDSALVRLDRVSPPDGIGRDDLFGVVDAAFAERRKTISNGLRRLGVADPDAVVGDAAIDGAARPDTLSFDEYVALTRSVRRHGRPA